MRTTCLPRAAATLAAVGFAGLFAARAALPALNQPPTSESRPGTFEWADLFTGNAATAEQFYTQLLGWTSSGEHEPRSYANSGGRREYIVLSRDGVPVAGIVDRGGRNPEKPARWIGYIAVSNLDDALNAVTQGGGRVVAPAHDVPARGRQAIIVDPEGAVVGLLQSSSGDLPYHAAANGEWTWFELYSRSPSTAGNFYARIAGYTVAPDNRSAESDHYLFRASSGGRAHAGISPLPHVPDAVPDWLGYIRVNNLDDIVAKVPSLGGQVIEAPQPAKLDSRYALIADPTGGVVGLVEFTPESSGNGGSSADNSGSSNSSTP